MKKKTAFIFLLWITVLLLWGCGKEPRQQCRYVTQIDITCDHDGLQIHRLYKDTEKMEAMLLYLRLLHPGGPPATDPDIVDADIYEIKVSLSDGTQHLYSQKDHRYFRREQMGWQSISAEKAAQLYTLLRHYQSDL